MTDKPLSGKRALFVAEYLKDRNATQAAIRAGYSEATAKQQGSRLLTRVDVRAAVVVSDTRVVAKVEKSAADISRVAWSIAEDPEAPPSARIQALNLEARRFREYADKHEHSGPDGGPIPLEVLAMFANVSPDRIKELAQRGIDSA